MGEIETPTAFAPETLWTYDEAVAAHEAAANAAERVRTEEVGTLAEPLAQAVLDVLAAHIPVRREEGGTPWVGGASPGARGVRAHAACHGGGTLPPSCWGDGWRDTATPWPCAAVRPILAALEVSRGR